MRLLDETEFNWKQKGLKRSYHCKTCSRRYLKDHYTKNREYYLTKAKKRNFKILEQAHEYIGNFLMAHPCVDCGETDILVLEFDHKNRSEKLLDVANIVKRGFCQKKLITEISLCEVRCANCHRRKTERENNGWRLKYAPVA